MIIFKRGDTFSFTGTASAVVNGVRSADFTGWTARAQVRTKGGRLVQELQVTWLDAATGKMKIMQTAPHFWVASGNAGNGHPLR